MSKELQTVGVFATAWGSKYGGLNALSTRLSKSLANILSENTIYFFVERYSDEDFLEAKTYGINLFAVEYDQNLPNTINQLISTDNIRFQWWIGNDIKTGEYSNLCRDAFGGKSINIMHMSYYNYAYVKHENSNSLAIAEKIEKQTSIFRNSDKVAAVGPLLLERLKEITKGEKDTFCLIPGLSHFPTKQSSNSHLSGISFGRFDENELFLKQSLLPVLAFSRAIKNGFNNSIKGLIDSDLKIVGATEEVGKMMQHISFEEAEREINLQIFDFIEDESKVEKFLAESNLAIILSWHEGFGLTAWEAISAGVPLIVSKNTGVYKYIESLGGEYLGCIHSVDIKGKSSGEPNEDDIKEVTRLITSISNNIRSSKANAEKLAHKLKKDGLSWDSCAEEFAVFLDLPVLRAILSYGNKDKTTIDEPKTSLDSIQVQKLFDAADIYYKTGHYDDALQILNLINEYKLVLTLYPSIGLDATILMCEIYLRQNKYSWVKALVKRISGIALESEDWLRYVRVKSIENVLLRDLGNYYEALVLVENLDRIAKMHVNNSKVRKSLCRKMSRTLSLSGNIDRAIEFATKAIEFDSRTIDTNIDPAISLAFGEAYRHGKKWKDAIEWYSSSIKLAEIDGDTDCFIWAMIGLGDSLFLDNQDPIDINSRLMNFLDKYGTTYKLEKLHLNLNTFARAAKYEQMPLYPEQLIQEYKNLGIFWPADFITSVMHGDFTKPKPF